MPLNWIPIGIGAVAAFALSWLLHTVDVGFIEARHKTELTAQENALHEACDKDKAITKEANDELQNQVNIIARKLTAAKRVRSDCIVPLASSPQPTPSGGEHAGTHGVTSDALFEYAADCETYRQQRITLEGFIKLERSSGNPR